MIEGWASGRAVGGAARCGVIFWVYLAAHAIGGEPASRPALVAEDFAFNYDQPAFFQIVGEMREGRAPGAGPVVDDWRKFLERPGDFRGAAVRVRGVLARNKDPFRLVTRPELGELTQLELTGGQPGLAATVICTDDVGDLAIGDTLEFAARFVMVRSYYAESGRVAHAPLFVAAGPLSTARAAPRSDTGAARHLPWIAGSFGLALVAFWVILWRAAKAPSRSLGPQQRIPLPTEPWRDEIIEQAAQPERPDDSAAREKQT